MEKLPAITGALIGALAGLACIGFVTGTLSWVELITGAAAFVAVIAALVAISEAY